MTSRTKNQLLIITVCVVLVLNLFTLTATALDENIYSNKNGLITSNVNDACQTTDGYIWIAQYEGLSRYDGERFENINHALADDEELSLEQLSSVENDSQNNLYIGSKQEGLILYENGDYHRINANGGLNVLDIFIENDIVYVATSDGAYLYKNGTVTWLEDTRGHEIISIAALNGNIYYTDNAGIAYVFDGSSHKFYDKEGIKTVRVFDGNVFLGSMYGTLIEISSQGNTQTFDIIENHPINALAKFDDVIYIGTDGGIFIFDGDTVSRMKNLSSDTVAESIFVDYENSLWVSTPVGLYKFHSYSIENLLNTYGLPETVVNACFYYKNLLYVATDNGVIIIDEKNRKLVTNELTTRLDNMRIRDFAELNGELYIATYSSAEYAIVIYDGKELRNLSSEKMLGSNRDSDAIFTHSQVRCLTTYKDKLIIGTNYGITLAQGSKYKTVELTPRPLSITAYDDKFYVCTDGDGIHIFNYNLEETGVIEDTLGKVSLRTIEFQGGVLYGLGTCLYYQKDGNTQRLNIDNTGSVVDLRETSNALIIYTNGGVSFFDKSTILSNNVRLIARFNYSSGLNSGVTANGKSFYNQKTDTYYFNCQDGVYKYGDDTLSYESDTLKMAVNGVVIDGESVPITDEITIGRHATRLTVDLAVLTYLNCENLQIYYQMSDTDDEVSVMDFDEKQTLEYTNLSGGNHVLTIYAVNDKGIKSNQIKVNFFKELAWYELTSARIVLAGLIIGIVVLIMHFLTRRKMKALKAQADWRKKLTLDSVEAIANTIDAKDDYKRTLNSSCQIINLHCQRIEYVRRKFGNSVLYRLNARCGQNRCSGPNIKKAG